MLNFKKIDNVTYKQIDIMKHTIAGILNKELEESK